MRDRVSDLGRVSGRCTGGISQLRSTCKLSGRVSEWVVGWGEANEIHADLLPVLLRVDHWTLATALVSSGCAASSCRAELCQLRLREVDPA